MCVSISDDEKKLFRDAVSSVKPLKSSQNIAPESKRPITTFKRKVAQPVTDEQRAFHAVEKYDTVFSEDKISYAKPGLQHKRFSELKKGKLKIDATLDLHGYTRDKAHTAMDHFLVQCQHDKLRVVCIIHGKSHSAEQTAPILKNFINHYLREQEAVLAFHSAKNYHGGTGAVYVLLRNN